MPRRKVTLIGLMGYARAGKDTAARHMPGWQRLAFADPLKRDVLPFCSAFYHINPLNCDEAQKAVIRPIMVAHGRIMRDLDPDWWIDALAVDMRRLTPGLPAVITDCRYPNEARWVKGQGGVVVVIHRPSIGPANEEERASIEEALCQRLHGAIVVNDGTPEELGPRVLEAAGAEAAA